MILKIILFLIFSFNLISQEITLEEALKIALENNKNIKETKFNNDYIYGRYLQERSQAFPKLNAIVYDSKQSDETFYKFSQGLFPKEQDILAYEISLDQTLYSWGKISSAIKASRYALQSTDISLKLTEEEVIKITLEAFYDVLLQKELVKISKENLKQKENHLKKAEDKYELGIGTEYEILAAKVNLENAKTSLIKAENGLKILKERLKFVLGVDSDIEPIGDLEVKEEIILSYEEALKIALEERKELKIQELIEKGQREFINIQSSQNKPKLSLTGSYSRKNLQAGNYEIDASSWNIYLNLSIPIFDGFRTKGSVILAKSDYEKAKLEKEKMVDSIKLELYSLINEVKEAIEIIKTTEKTLELAEKWYEMAEEGYKLGIKTNLDLEDAQLNLSNAKVSLAKAKRDYLISIVKLKRSMGILREDTLK